MSLADLARFVAAEPDFDSQWRLVVEFLREYHQESAEQSQQPGSRPREWCMG
jgi:hypothetical protein